MTADERREELKGLLGQARDCTRCSQLAATRTTVVFGAGNADADLMFVGEAPGANEDKQGLPFVGQAGRLLDQLLGEIGLARTDVFIANVLKCLRYNAQVQLGDGSWERIGRLVRAGYAGAVRSVATDGTIVNRRVIGWHETPRGGRRVYRLSFRSSKRAGANLSSTQLTGDHPVLTERGYVPVEQLRRGDRIAIGQGLSEVARDVAVGTLLGDGTISAKASHLVFTHGARQREFALLKMNALRELAPKASEYEIVAVGDSGRMLPVVSIRTRADRSIGVLRREFYPDVKDVPDWLADRLTPRMLAIWFMDDGYTRLRHNRRPRSEIATNSFSANGLQILIEGLRNLGLNAKALRGRLFFDADATLALSRLIAPFVPPTMRYKLHPEAAERLPFRPSLYEPGPPSTFYDDVVIEDVTDAQGADRTFFCLDVEETHNFVTRGGVVHNCRPPGNRDPLPAEIENCKGYLHGQVELIQPRVICTLGNFSTKLLREDPTGITRLHGRPEERRIGERDVVLYPLFHPAAALYTPAMLETLRADFAGIPPLLAPPEPVEPERVAEEAELQLGLF